MERGVIVALGMIPGWCFLPALSDLRMVRGWSLNSLLWYRWPSLMIDLRFTELKSGDFPVRELWQFTRG